jgi:cytochrome c oxidase subunit 2
VGRGSFRGAARPLLAAAALLAGLAGPAFAGEDVALFHLGPENIGTYGKDIDSLYSVIMWLTTVTFLITEGLLLFFLLRFRAKEGGKAVYTHGNHRLELIWTILPGLILFWLAIFQLSTWRNIKVDRPPPKDGLVVEVMAKQFEWRFRYAGPDGKFDTEDDITTTNWLHVPVDTNVTVLLRSQDVIHSFFLPNLRLKQDTVPGLTISQWFRALKTTDAARKERGALGEAGADKFEFEIACAELCGIGHTTMRGFLHVHDKEDFFKWIDGVYVKEIREYGSDPEDLINKYWPKDQNRIEDSWLRDSWPAAMKAAWPKKGE